MLLNKSKETPVKFNPGLSANRPSNNWALALRIVPCQKGWIPDSLLVKLGFPIQDSFSRFPDSRAQDFRFHKSKFTGFRKRYCL